MTDTPLPGLEPAEAPRSRARHGGDDAVVEAWAHLFDALLELGSLGIDPDTALSVLKGYAGDWPL